MEMAQTDLLTTVIGSVLLEGLCAVYLSVYLIFVCGKSQSGGPGRGTRRMKDCLPCTSCVLLRYGFKCGVNWLAGVSSTATSVRTATMATVCVGIPLQRRLSHRSRLKL